MQDMKMRILQKFIGLWFCAILLTTGTANADQLYQTYQAYFSAHDHYNSHGQALTTAATIIAQDRANFHRFRTPDDIDVWDGYFTTPARRLMVQEMLDRGGVSATVRSDIVRFNMSAEIEIWTGKTGPYLLVYLLP